MAEQTDESRQPNQPSNLMKVQFEDTGADSSIVQPKEEGYTSCIDCEALQVVLDRCHFDGLPDEDPNMHLHTFTFICHTLGSTEVSKDVMKLRFFPLTLRDGAKEWILSFPIGTFTTWDDLAKKFLERYFPLSVAVKLRRDLWNFQQGESEPLFEAWMRYKKMLRKCPPHGMDLKDQIVVFHCALNGKDRFHVNACAGGTIQNKTPEEAYHLIEDIAMEERQFYRHSRKSLQPIPPCRSNKLDQEDILPKVLDTFFTFVRDTEARFQELLSSIRNTEDRFQKLESSTREILRRLT